MTKQRYSRSPNMPYAYGWIPLDTGGSASGWIPRGTDGSAPGSSLTERMDNLHGRPPYGHWLLFAGHHNQVEFPTRWQHFIAYIQDILKQPSKYDWWESGEITPKLMRLWGIR